MYRCLPSTCSLSRPSEVTYKLSQCACLNNVNNGFISCLSKLTVRITLRAECFVGRKIEIFEIFEPFYECFCL